jgi:spore photoproduct lyase
MKPDKLYIDASLPMDEEVEYLVGKLGCEPEPVSDPTQVYTYINQAPDPVSRGKKTVYITRNKGALIRECPGTSFYTCCDYTILHTGSFCQMDCAYCILQAYFHPPVLQYFAGINRLQEQVKPLFAQHKIFRIGTGEFTDSLIWEPVSLMPRSLVKIFAAQHNSVLELKTKTVNISSLLDLDHNGKTVLAWSLNTPDIIKHQEKGTASLNARLKAAQTACAKGYRVAFHFDPLFIYPGCEQAYQKVVDLIFDHVAPADIVWISLGTFRFMPALKQMVENRFPQSDICYGEFIMGLDNKMRYFKPLRISLYKVLAERLKMHAPDLLVYFCMEDEDVWEQTFGFFPGKEGELGVMLDTSAAEHCGLNKLLIPEIK